MTETYDFCSLDGLSPCTPPANSMRMANALELIGRGHSPPRPRTALSIQQPAQTRPASPVRSSEMLDASEINILGADFADSRVRSHQFTRKSISNGPEM